MIDYKMTSDVELISLIRSDDQFAFSEIYRRFSSDLYIFAYRKIGDKESTRDLIQELFIEIWIKRKHLNFRSEIRAYLFQAVKNRIYNYYRNNETSDLFIEKFQNYINTYSDSTDFLIRHNDLSRAIYKEVEALPKLLKEVYKLSREYHLNKKQISALLNLTEKNVEMRLYRAMLILKGRLRKFLILLT